MIGFSQGNCSYPVNNLGVWIYTPDHKMLIK